MKVNDGLIGLVLLCLSALILWHVRDFPDIPGQTYGASLFPTVIAGALAVCSVMLIVTGFRSGQGLITSANVKRTSSIKALLVTLAVLFGYALWVDTLGFYMTACLALFILMVTYGVKLKVAVLLSVVVTLIIHFAFYKLLGVPLPWGLLENHAW
jgi:putative tricarboxylic transport membrane protein